MLAQWELRIAMRNKKSGKNFLLKGDIEEDKKEAKKLKD